MVLKKFINNIKTLVFYQSIATIFFRVSGIHRLIGFIFFYVARFFYKQDIYLNANIKKLDFSRLKKYHHQNYVNEYGTWFLNNIAHENILHSTKKNKDDYTRELVFSYLEWLFASVKKIEDDDFLISLTKKSLKSKFSQEPSSASLRIYPLMFAFKNNLIEEEFAISCIKECFSIIHKKIELGTGGNHFLDNLISLSLISSILHTDKFLKIYLGLLIKQINLSTKNGYYEEKNPTYSEGLYIRLNLMLDMISTKTRSKTIREFYNKLKKLSLRFKKYPLTQINDSYLSFSSIYDSKFNYHDSDFVNNYYAYKTFNNNIASIVLNSVGKRGFLAHAHDASMSVSIFDKKSRKFLVTGFGTPHYKNDELRDNCKSYYNYPTVTNKFKRDVISNGSFRISKIFKPSIDNISKKDFLDRKSKIGITFFQSGIIISSKLDDNIFSFFSDFDNLDLGKKSIRIENYSSMSKAESYRYDGIYNKIKCYEYKITFNNFIKIIIIND